MLDLMLPGTRFSRESLMKGTRIFLKIWGVNSPPCTLVGVSHSSQQLDGPAALASEIGKRPRERTATINIKQVYFNFF